MDVQGTGPSPVPNQCRLRRPSADDGVHVFSKQGIGFDRAERNCYCSRRLRTIANRAVGPVDDGGPQRERWDAVP